MKPSRLFTATIAVFALILPITAKAVSDSTGADTTYLFRNPLWFDLGLGGGAGSGMSGVAGSVSVLFDSPIGLFTAGLVGFRDYGDIWNSRGIGAHDARLLYGREFRTGPYRIAGSAGLCVASGRHRTSELSDFSGPGIALDVRLVPSDPADDWLGLYAATNVNGDAPYAMLMALFRL